MIDAAEAHEAIVAAYAATDPLSWDSYPRRNLALHASEVGQLDHLLEDPRFLLAADFARLLQLLPVRPEPPQAGIVAVLRLAGSAAAELSPVPRARQLALAAAHLGLAELRRAFAAWVNDGWVPLWAHSLVPHQSLAGHGGSVRAVALGRLGDRDVIVSGGDDGTVRVWDASGAPRQSLTGHAGSVRAVAVGRAGDQDVVVSGGDDGTVRVWDATGRPVIEPLAAHAEPVRAVVIGRAGERDVIVSGGDDGLRVWDAATGQILERPRHWMSDLLRERGITDIFRRRDITDASSVKALAIGRPGGRDVIVSICEECEVWDAARRTRICSLDTWYTGPLTAVVIGNVRGRDVIVTASSDGKVALWDWDAATDWRYWEEVGEAAGPLKAVAIGQMAGRQMIVAGGADGTVWTWDVAAPEPTGSLLARQAATVNAVAIGRTANREIIVSGGRDGTVRVWDAAPGKHDGDQLPSHDSRVETVAAGAIGGRDVVVSGGDDGLHVWDATTGRAIRDLEPFWRVSGVKAVAIAWSGHSNRNLILIAIHKGEIRAHTGNRNELRGRPKTVAAAREPSEAIVTSGRDGAWAWNTQTPQRIFPGAVYVTPVAVGQIGGRDVVVSGHEDGMLRIWNLETPRTVHRPDLITGNLADLIAGNRLEAAKLRPGPVASLATHGARMTAVAIGQIDGRDVIVTGHADGSVRVWDPAAKRLKDRLTGHLRPVTAVAAGRAGGRNLIVSGSTDRKVCVWDVATGRLETLEMLDLVTGLAVSASHLAAASGIAVAVFSVPLSAPAATRA
jgi:WD40 repeat protein